MTPIELLHKTRRTLDERGWCKDRFFDNQTGQVCLVGALIFAHSGNPDASELSRCQQDPVFLKAYETLGMVTAEPGALSTWNDQLRRRRPDIDIALDQALEILERTTA